MDLAKPMTNNNYKKIALKIRDAAKSVAEETMKDAIKELKESNHKDETNTIDIAASLDGTFQKRGYSSLNGIVSAISMDNGKVIDTVPMTRYCKSCIGREELKKENPGEYEKWKVNHKCPKNHSGSAGAMEVTGAKQIFERSIEKHGVRITQFYGDGDSKSYDSVKETYEGITVEKMECVGHVQKRVGTRLRNLKQKNKALGGRGKLTNSVIDRLQNYYGIAIRSNIGNLSGMKNGVLASLFHVASSKEHLYHSYCPEGENSWCNFNKDKVTGQSTHKHGPGLPVSVIAKIKPIYKDLSSDELLNKCLHGKTQNHNECLNGMIWERLPKTRFCSLVQLELGVYDAIANFNIGRKASVLIYEKLGVCPGKNMLCGSKRLNRKRLVFLCTRTPPQSKGEQK